MAPTNQLICRSCPRPSGLRLACVSLATVLLLSLLTGCAAPSAGGCVAPSVCGKAAPCGPEYLPVAVRRLLPQGCLGADFRQACCEHDRCYDCGQLSRQQCDQEFGQRMRRACDDSACPTLCRMVAGLMHGCVVVGGGPSYRQK